MTNRGLRFQAEMLPYKSMLSHSLRDLPARHRTTMVYAVPLNCAISARGWQSVWIYLVKGEKGQAFRVGNIDASEISRPNTSLEDPKDTITTVFIPHGRAILHDYELHWSKCRGEPSALLCKLIEQGRRPTEISLRTTDSLATTQAD